MPPLVSPFSKKGQRDLSQEAALFPLHRDNYMAEEPGQYQLLASGNAN